MSQYGADPGIISQWERKISRWVGHGWNREQILYEMTAANWRYDEAEQMVRKSVRKQKRNWVIMMIICGAIAVLGVGVTFVSLTTPQGGVIYVPFGFTIGFIYSLVRLVKIRA